MLVVIPGGSGLIGRCLSAQLLARGHSVRVSTRSPAGAPAPRPDLELHAWDPNAGPPDPALLAGADAVVNLIGESVAAGRWTAARRLAIRQSRVGSNRWLVEAMARMASPPALLIAGSAVGIYGDRGGEILDESAACGGDFLAEVAAELEAEAGLAQRLGVRVVALRTGVVLSRAGGALPRLLPQFRLGLGGPIGDGRQYFPWIHEEDVAGLVLHCLENEALSGPVNAVAPRAPTSREFALELGRALGRPALLPLPARLLRLLFGEMAGVLLVSQRAEPAAALASGYRFRQPDLGQALASLLARRRSAR